MSVCGGICCFLELETQFFPFDFVSNFYFIVTS